MCNYTTTRIVNRVRVPVSDRVLRVQGGAAIRAERLDTHRLAVAVPLQQRSRRSDGDLIGLRAQHRSRNDQPLLLPADSGWPVARSVGAVRPYRRAALSCRIAGSMARGRRRLTAAGESKSKCG